MEPNTRPCTDCGSEFEVSSEMKDITICDECARKEPPRMRVLSFGNLHFQLPDDFEGNLSDALRAMADYHDSIIAEAKPQTIGEKPYDPGDASAKDDSHSMWEKFLNDIENEKRITGVVCVTDYLLSDGIWASVYIDLNDGTPNKAG